MNSFFNHPLNILLMLTFGCQYGYSQNKANADTAKIILCETTLFYPQTAQDNNITGTVLVSYDIDSNCRIINIHIKKGKGYGCNEAAINALKKCKPVLVGTRKKCDPLFNILQPFTFKKPDEE